jgi:uncharacterized protein YyaL (SSP411 family)
MIASLARASVVLKNSLYLDAAIEAFDFLRDNMMTDGFNLSHSFAGGEKGPDAFLDDYAFLIQGSLELYSATLQQQYLNAALDLQRMLDAYFADENKGGYYFTGNYGDSRIPRLKESYDGAVPSGNSVELTSLVTLWKITGDARYMERAAGIESAFYNSISASPTSYSMMISGILYAREGGTEVLLAGDSDDPEIREMLEYLRSGYRPWTTVVLVNPESTSREYSWISSDISAVPAAYLCRNGTCSLPVKSLRELEELIAP